MKKFKTSAEKRQLEDQALSQLLADKNLLYNALVRFIHLPLGLALSLGLLLVSLLTGRHWNSFEHLLYAYIGIAAIASLYTQKSWLAFRAHQLQLQHVRNAFVGSKLYPLLFAGLLVYICLPLGWLATGLSLAFLALSSLYLRLTRHASQPSLGQSLLLGLASACILLIPSLELQTLTSQQHNLAALAAALGGGLLLSLLSWRYPQWMQLQH